MKILLMHDTFNLHPQVKDVEFVPRVGDFVDIFFEPLPKVKSVVCYPNDERLAKIPGLLSGTDVTNIAAIICVE